MLSLFSRNEKWNKYSFHSFREMKSEMIFCFTLFEKWKWNWDTSRSRSRSEISKTILRILEKRDSRWFLHPSTRSNMVLHPSEMVFFLHSAQASVALNRYNINSTYATQRNTRPRVLNIDWPTALCDVSTGFHWINFDTKKPFNIHTTQHPPTYGTTMLHPSEMVFFSLSPSPSCSKLL